MEKQQNLNNSCSAGLHNNNGCGDSTVVNVKDYSVNNSGMDYQEPPPAYGGSGMKMQSQVVQVTKVVAVAAVAIAGMLSFALVFSAWLTSSAHNACRNEGVVPGGASFSPVETFIGPEALKGMLMSSAHVHLPLPAAALTAGPDLDSAETKRDPQSNSASASNESKMDKSSNSKQDSSSEEDDDGEGERGDGNNEINNMKAEDDAAAALTMFKFPMELNLQEHMFERKHRSHMNCVIEKKKAEEIVDEQSKPLPPLLGINMSTDPRYLHFTGEKMAISCDSGNDHRQMPHMTSPPPQQPPQSPPGYMDHQQMAGAQVPIHIIGPIPLSQAESSRPHSMSGLFPFLVPQQHGLEHGLEQDSDSVGSGSGPIFLSQHAIPFPLSAFQPGHGQGSGEFRERASPHPIPIMPRSHVQHVIRPRSVDNVEDKLRSSVASSASVTNPLHRVKRCACDCACKNP